MKPNAKKYPFADLARREKQYTEWRRHLHRAPELSGEEARTAAFVCERLKEANVPYKMLAGGVVARLDHPNGKRELPAIGLRADMDALPIREENTFKHRSANPGVMHACGHDGHTAMLLAAADFLAARREHLAGTVYFIFQPAEEEGDGAVKMMNAGLFRKFPMRRVFGLHNWPGLPVGQFAVFDAEVMAAVDLFDIEIRGQGGHAAIPHKGKDALLAAAQFMNLAQTLVSRDTDPADTAVVSFTACHAGENYNVLPATVHLKGTLRYFRKQTRRTLVTGMRRLLSSVCGAYGLKGNFTEKTVTVATINEKESADFCESAARAVSSRRVRRDLLPSTGGEDFAYMLEEVPGCYAWLGNGNSSPLHTPKYDFNDAALGIGARYWCALSCRPRSGPPFVSRTSDQ